MLQKNKRLEKVTSILLFAVITLIGFILTNGTRIFRAPVLGRQKRHRIVRQKPICPWKTFS